LPGQFDPMVHDTFAGLAARFAEIADANAED
jgi:hypothetical protein